MTAFALPTVGAVMPLSLFRFLGLVSLGTLLGCGTPAVTPVVPSPPCETDICEITGRVEWMTFEGGFFAIRGDDQALYDSHDLPAAFRHDGLRVAATLRRRLDLGCIHMAGTIVNVLSIRRL
jgi:hypothetical protein